MAIHTMKSRNWNQERIHSGMKEKANNVMVIPYEKGLSESIRRAGNEVGIKTIFSAKDTIKKRLTKVKPKQNNNKEVIYKIPCQHGAEYIGETGRNVEVRCSEHRRLLEMTRQLQQHGEPLDEVSSHLAVHAASNNHLVDWSEVEVVAKKSHW
jgi:hypothetical protein